MGSPKPDDDETDKLDEAVGGVPPVTTPVGSDEEKPTKEVDSEDGSGKKKKKKKKRKATPHASPDSSAAEATDAEPEQEGWSTVESAKQRKSRARKARAEDRLAKDGRKNVRLEDLLGPDGRRYFTPPRQTVDGSDDEDWMDDFSHPIDWYVGQIDEICDVPSPSYSKELRRKLKYAWKNYVPGDPCPFERCQHRPKGARIWTSLPRYARHLVETHLPKRPEFRCVKEGPVNACHEWTDGLLFRTQRRGEMIRHLMENGMHNRSLKQALAMVQKVWDTKGRVSKVELRMIPNELNKRFMLTEHDWNRLNGKKTQVAAQSETGSGGTEDTAEEIKGTKRARSKARAPVTDRNRDRSESTSQAKKPRAGVSGGKGSSKKDTKPVVQPRSEKVPATPGTAKTAGLSKTKQKTLTDVTKIVTNALGSTAASQVVDTYLKQQQVLQQIKDAPKSVKGRKQPESTQTSSSVYTPRT